jgi:hypothetical protein
MSELKDNDYSEEYEVDVDYEQTIAVETPFGFPLGKCHFRDLVQFKQFLQGEFDVTTLLQIYGDDAIEWLVGFLRLDHDEMQALAKAWDPPRRRRRPH